MRLALRIEYNGTNYFGWQKQKIHKEKTIQYLVDKAISNVANHKINSICGGRTDTGVHAFSQIIHFDTKSKRSNFNWIKGINTFLPNDIIIKDVFNVSKEFHARFSAIDRTYRYIILNQDTPSSIFVDNFLSYKGTIDILRIRESFKYLIGEKDFSCFKSSGCSSLSPIKNIKKLNIKRIRDFIIIDVTANSFLYHMVRNMVGCFIDIGTKKIESKKIKKILLAKDRRKIGITVEPKGLYLLKINYPKIFNIKVNDKFSLFN